MSSLSSSWSISRRIFLAADSSATSTVVFGTIVSSAASTLKPALSSALRTAARASGAARDRALDVVLRHGVRTGLLDRVLQRQIAGGIRPALLRRDDDRPRQLREEFAALGVRGALLVLDRRPFAMP